MEASAVLCGTVVCVSSGNLLVCDRCTGQNVLVHTDRACCYCCGDEVRIEYSGAMTMSIPPQISAQRISRLGCC